MWERMEIKRNKDIRKRISLTKKKDYADTYHDNSTNMAQALEKRAYDLVGEL